MPIQELREDQASWRSQLLRGTAEMMVLALLDDGPNYGVGLIELSGRDGRAGLVEGTIYPLLHRLEKEGKVVGQWVVSAPVVRPRKMYKLTRDGRTTLRMMKREWFEFSSSVARLIDHRHSANDVRSAR